MGKKLASDFVDELVVAKKAADAAKVTLDKLLDHVKGLGLDEGTYEGSRGTLTVSSRSVGTIDPKECQAKLKGKFTDVVKVIKESLKKYLTSTEIEAMTSYTEQVIYSIKEKK
jgi:hypothetical protein